MLLQAVSTVLPALGVTSDNPLLVTPCLAMPPLGPPTLICVVAAVVAASVQLIGLWDRTSGAAIARGVLWTGCCVALDAGLATAVAAALRSTYDAVAPGDMTIAGAIIAGVGIGLAPVAAAAIRLPGEARNQFTETRSIFSSRVMDVHARYESRNVEQWACAIAKVGSPEDIGDRAAQYFEVRARTSGLELADGLVDALRRTGRHDPGSPDVRIRTIVRMLLDHKGAPLVRELRRDAKKASRTRRERRTLGPRRGVATTADPAGDPADDAAGATATPAPVPGEGPGSGSATGAGAPTRRDRSEEGTS